MGGFTRALFAAYVALAILIAHGQTTVQDPATQTTVGKVVSIHDGDSFTVLDADKVQQKVRLEGIDAPEQRQAFGARSKQALGEKLHEHEVRIVWSTTDRYGRILGDVYLGDRHINEEMVADGWAWHFKKYSSSPKLATAEESARRKQVGLWSATAPVAPWDFRSKLDLAETDLEVAPPPSQQVMVYITKTGDKYHRAGCRHLTDTSRPLSLDDARQTHQPCSVCKPPLPNGGLVD